MHRYFSVGTLEIKVMIHFFYSSIFGCSFRSDKTSVPTTIGKYYIPNGKYIKYREVVNYKPSIVCLTITMDIFLYFSGG